MPVLIPLDEINVGFHPSFSRHGRDQASLPLLIWLNENVGFHPSFSRHGRDQASLPLLIWLNENAPPKCLLLPSTLWVAQPYFVHNEGFFHTARRPYREDAGALIWIGD